VRWSFQIAKVAGIPIRVHATFIIFLAFLYVWLSRGRSPNQALGEIGLLLALFGCVVLHELGHATTAKRFGVRTRDITLLPIGGIARLERIPEKPSQEIAVALAGPAVNIVIVILLVGVLVATGKLGATQTPAGLEGNFFANLLAVNLFLAIFNMIPAFPMDGGRVLRALLATRLDYVRATQIAAGIGQGIAFLFGFAGLFGLPGIMPANPVLLFIALFVFLGAGQEATMVQMRSVFDGVPVWRAMIRDFRALRADEPLSRAVELLLNGHQQDFPVVSASNGAPMGILTRADLISAIAGGGTDRKVEEVAKRSCGTAHPKEMLELVFQRMQESGCPAVPVVESDGTLVGMVTLENVGELAMVQAALGSRGRAARRT
jgi:Zn-dependent protease/CBS domain-containing protein